MCATPYRGARGADNKRVSRVEYKATHLGTRFIRIPGEPEKAKVRLKVKHEIRLDAQQQVSERIHAG